MKVNIIFVKIHQNEREEIRYEDMTENEKNQRKIPSTKEYMKNMGYNGRKKPA